MGPTGAGKTAAAIALAARLPVGDRQRGLRAGVSRPGHRHGQAGRSDPRAGAASPDRYSRSRRRPIRPATSCAMPRAAIAAIHARGRMPLLVGGTMLYFHALLHGLAALPEADAGPQARARRARRARSGRPACMRSSPRVDPAAAARIHPNDPQRIQRALEVFHLTGAADQRIAGGPARRRSPGCTALSIVLSPARRAVLHERIERALSRHDERGVSRRGACAPRPRRPRPADIPAMRAVGYRQLWAHLDGAYGLEEGVRRGIVATRQLAKRQLTWLGRCRDAQWVEPDDDDRCRFDGRPCQASSRPNAS